MSLESVETPEVESTPGESGNAPSSSPTTPPTTPDAAPASTPDSSPTSAPVPSEGDVAPAAAAPAFVPNFKVKVLEQEVEVDELFRGLMTDAEKEKKVRDLVSKAHGLDFYKTKHETLQGEHTKFQQGFQALGQMLSKDDPKGFQTFVDFWKIPKEKLYQHVAELLKYDELSPDEKAKVEQQRSLEVQAEQGQTQYQQLLERYNNDMAAVRTRDLDTAISRPDISGAAQEYDARVGKPGSFRGEVIRRGQMAARLTGQDITVDQAIKEVMLLIGYQENETAPGQAALPTVAPVQQKKLPTLPNLGSGGASPVKKVVKSLADLRAIQKSMQKQA